MAVKTMHHSYK